MSHCGFCADGTHGFHCTRCGAEDDSIVLDPEGDPDLCAACASDRPPPSPDRAVGPTLPDGPVAERAALVEHAPAPSPSSPGVDAAVPPLADAWRDVLVADRTGCPTAAMTPEAAYVAGGDACMEDERLGCPSREGPEDPELRVWWCRGYSTQHVTGATVRLARERDALRAHVERLRLSDRPWPATDAVQRLIHAADHLLAEHNCDCLGHEEIRECTGTAEALCVVLAATPKEWTVDVATRIEWKAQDDDLRARAAAVKRGEP